MIQYCLTCLGQYAQLPEVWSKWIGMALNLDFRKALMCIPRAKKFLCKRGTALSFVDIKVSRNPAPAHRCPRHRGRNKDNSTLPNHHRCNVTKVIANLRNRCQGRRECWVVLNERHLGNACVKEVKFLRINFTCDQSKLCLLLRSTIKIWKIVSRVVA